MLKPDMKSPDLTAQNIEKIAELFPDCLTEIKDEQGNIVKGIDFDVLRQELSSCIVEGPKERYQINWPGKKEALVQANTPITKTLRPCREESVDFDTTKNLFIEGDNLEALKLLQESYMGKVKMIYIDPPYNTGKDFVYKDTFTMDKEEYELESGQKDEEGGRLVANTEANGRFHSDWLSMMYSRLKLARNLLTDDGIVVISIDENEHSNIEKLGKDIFGEGNFCGDIVWKNSSKNDQKYISIQHEYFVVFVKNKQFNPGEWVEKKSGLDLIYQAFNGFKKEFKNDWDAIHAAALEWYKKFPASNPITDSKHYSWMDERGVYFPDNISGPNDGQYVYDVLHPVTGQPCKLPSTGWRYPEKKMLERIAENRVHFGKDHTTVPNNKTYLKDTEYQSLTSMKFVDGRSASKRLQSLFGEKVFTNPKDELLLKDLFKAMGIKENDIVLDFFAGSASTMHAIFELNQEQESACSAILVQLPEDLYEILRTAQGSAKKVTKNAIDYLKRKKLPESVSEIGKERIRLVGKKLENRWTGDIGFRVLKIDSSNMKDVYYTPNEMDRSLLAGQVENIKEDRTSEDLLFQVLLDWGVDLMLPITREEIQGKTVYFVDEDTLAACFDDGIDEAFVKELAKRNAMRVVFKENGFKADDVKSNVEQIFTQLAPATEVRAI
ncbi:site-specific DNA-methyltransferase [Sulfurimonas sp. HSL1-2]|uniref:site-specific DNA-methyltransferase n=1 Tax=Thiomicrolovo zhangzhouensis TaxID=3131933 RepID=UPI0031F91156